MDRGIEMGYFSNGAEHADYLERFCHQCVNYRDYNGGRGCFVMDTHMLFQNEGHEAVLDHFIPQEDGIHNDQCKMFVER